MNINSKVYYVILDDGILLSKKEYNHWQEIQNEYYDNFKACLGPWSYEELIDYLETDFKDENSWPFTRGNILEFFNGSEAILNSNR